jgi:hypothetical protein
MLAIFKARQTRRYRLSVDFAKLIGEVRSIVDSHRESPIEFSRHGNLIICQEGFKYKILSHPMLKDYMEKAKIFIHEAELMIQ